MMQRLTKKNLFIASLYAGVLIIGMIIGPKFNRENADSANSIFLPFGNDHLGKTQKVLQLISEKYVDSVKTDTLERLAIEEVLSKLDPHSTYMPASEANRFEDDLDGQFSGIGIEYITSGDTMIITDIIPKSPAAISGLRSGDKVLKINKKDITGKNAIASDLYRLLQGEVGTPIQLTIKRKGEPNNKLIHIKRNTITISSISAGYLINNKTGYIKLSKFGSNTADEFSSTLRNLKKYGIQNLILDLRGNTGGYLDVAVKLADEFIDDKKLIVYTQGIHEPKTEYYATAGGLFEKGNLVILIDEKTASASEIVAGAIQDLDRGHIIGRNSFGKGLVQGSFDLGDGSVLNLTVARYYTPSGRSIQRPYSSGKKAYYHESNEIALNHTKTAQDTHQSKDSLFTDNPTKDKTYKTTSGRLMYSNGGITPDIFVAEDSLKTTSFYKALKAKRIIESFLFNYLTDVKKYNDPDEFLRQFSVNTTQYQQLVKLALSKGIKATEQQAAISKPVITRELKALLGKYYYGDAMFYKVWNKEDNVIKKAISILEK